MTRRIVHVVLLFAGLAPAVWAMCVLSADPPRAGVLAALAALGIVLNGTALRKPAFGMTVPLRVIACGVGLAVAAGMMRMWQWMQYAYLPQLPASDVARRGLAVTASHNFLWIAGTVGYVIITILVMPVPARKSRAAAGEPKGIDFRTFGR